MGLVSPALTLYPKLRRAWHLDQNHMRPVVEVKRQQIPLDPAYPITAHAAQGQTLPTTIIDLELGNGVGPMASYVAMTRVRRREHMLIYRDIKRGPYAKGPPEGPTCILRFLRRETIDWKENIENTHPAAPASWRLCWSCRSRVEA